MGPSLEAKNPLAGQGVSSLGKQTESDQQAVLSAVVGVVVSIVLTNTGPSVWYLPLSAILVFVLLPHWGRQEGRALHGITYALVLGFALIPGTAWILGPILPVVLDGPRLTWWNIRARELELFLIWCLFVGGVYVARRSA